MWTSCVRSRGERFNFLISSIKFPKQGRNTFKHSLRSGEIDVYHCLVSGNLVFLCYTTQEASLRIVYNFLAELEELHSKGQSGAETLSNLLAKWNRPDADKVNAARVKVDQIKQVMIQNIEKAMVRGAALSELETRSDYLAESASGFYQSSKDLKCKFLKEKLKLIAIIVAVVVVVIIIIVVSVVLSNPPAADTPTSRLLMDMPSPRLLMDLFENRQ